MISDGVFFENQRDIVIEALKTAKHSVKIAVAWINFNEYGDVINELLQNGIKIKIIVNDDVMNARYKEKIEELQNIGLKLKMFKTTNKSSFMHHKFCVIDKMMCMTGSFNWTKNANDNNYEDLNISHEIFKVEEYISQFDALWTLPEEELDKLRNPELCEICGRPKAYLCVFSEEGNETKADIYEVCGCGELKEVYNGYFELSVYYNLMAIFERYSDMDEEDFLDGIEINEQERKRAMDSEVSHYLSNIRYVNVPCQTIHAVGIYGHKPISKDDFVPIVQVLWKEKYTSDYVQDIYYLE